MKYGLLDWVSFALIIIGAINWGLVGAFDLNLVTEIFGEESTFSSLIFILVGLAGLYTAYMLAIRHFYETPGDI